MTADFISLDRIPSANSQQWAGELLRARLVLMRELEASLHCSRKALLALDLVAMESATGQQITLIREFDALLRQTTASIAFDRSAAPSASGLPGELWEVNEELRGSQNRIMGALRLQAALLTRAQCKLRVLANMLAGPTVPYGPLLGRDSGTVRLNWKQGERADSCRA